MRGMHLATFKLGGPVSVFTDATQLLAPLHLAF
jgi:hypothetical protein